MEYIKWKDEFSVSNTTIDAQHKELFQHINNFYNSVAGNSGKAAISKVVQDLEDYVVKHFTTEEGLMMRANYDDYPAHKAEHEKFIATVSDFRQRHNDGRLLLSLEVAGFVKNWITDHILKTDQLYKGKIW